MTHAQIAMIAVRKPVDDGALQAGSLQSRLRRMVGLNPAASTSPIATEALLQAAWLIG